MDGHPAVRSLLGALLLFALFPAREAVASAAEPPAPVAATLADVAFMAGHWTGGEDGDLSEEIWSPAHGDSMMGMWRYVQNGATRIYEILTLTAEGGNVVLRIRHFDPRLVAREEKDRPVTLPLVAKKEGEAVFEGPEHGVPGTVRLTYRREADGGLVSILEKKGSRQEFRFRKR
jgi:hypothetical protein